MKYLLETNPPSLATTKIIFRATGILVDGLALTGWLLLAAVWAGWLDVSLLVVGL